ncbi:MAG: TSUP family transporter [Desulfovibrio sp.]|jgi:uncharacterized membrane protein YfcA|nr:TSUP family transporter [Desulfovibrio sp.]
MEEITSVVGLFLLAAAFAAGFIDSIAGGGGLISLPALLVAGVPPHLALGTNKCMSTCGTAFSLFLYARGKSVNWAVAAKGIPFALLGAYAGSRAVLLLNPEMLAKIIIFSLPFAAVLTFVRRRERGSSCSPGRAAIWARIVPVCFGIGFYDGFLGPGTGTFLLLGLHFLLKMDLVGASGTAKTFNLASNIGGLTGFLLNGSVVFALGAPMALANIVGNILGSRMAMARGPEIVRKMLLVSLSLLLLTLIIRYF